MVIYIAPYSSSDALRHFTLKTKIATCKYSIIKKLYNATLSSSSVLPTNYLELTNNL